MRRIVVEKNGGPKELVLKEGPNLNPGSGELLVRVQAAGVNYLDIHQRRGEFPTPTPFTPGQEGVGVVIDIGADVSGYKVGDRVAWINVLGSYAEQALIPAGQAICLPAGLELEQGLLLQALTAGYLIEDYRNIRPGDAALVHAAAGGVGQLLIQWLKHLGAFVVATASSTSKLEIVRKLGADVAVNYVENSFVEAVQAATKGRGVDIAFDSVGKATLADSIASLAPLGTVVSFGSSSGPAPAVDVWSLMPKAARLATGALFVYIADPKELQRRSQTVLAAIKEGWLRPAVSRQFPLAEAGRAQAELEGRGTQGKLYLVP